MDRRGPPPALEDAAAPPRKVARLAPAALGRAELECMQAALNEGIDLEDVKFRPVGGGKNAAYVPAEAAV